MLHRPCKPGLFPCPEMPFLNVPYRSSLGCGREVSGESGVITSPDYPANYPINQECEWKITVTPGRSINITLDAMQLEQPFLGMCFDYVELKYGLLAFSSDFVTLSSYVVSLFFTNRIQQNM